MPDLGKYAAAVLSAYGVTLLLLAGIVVASLRHSAVARRRLDDIESRVGKDG